MDAELNKIYIAGCGGMLGSDVYKIFSDKGVEVRATDVDINEVWLEEGDVRDFDKISRDIKEFNPDALINLAAHTDLEYCEINISEAMAVNFEGAKNLALISKDLNIPYIYISTAGIFDGEKDYYDDDDLPNPLSIYGKSKYKGEQYVLNTSGKNYVFRAGWMMGGFEKDKKFISKIYQQLNMGHKSLYVVDDKLGTPTYTKDFANSLYLHLVNEAPYGLFNQVCRGSASRYEVAVEFIKLLEVDVDINIVKSDYFSKEYFAPRPRSEKLLNTRLDELNINYMREWKTCLKEYVNEIKGKEKHGAS